MAVRALGKRWCFYVKHRRSTEDDINEIHRWMNENIPHDGHVDFDSDTKMEIIMIEDDNAAILFKLRWC